METETQEMAVLQPARWNQTPNVTQQAPLFVRFAETGSENRLSNVTQDYFQVVPLIVFLMKLDGAAREDLQISLISAYR